MNYVFIRIKCFGKNNRESIIYTFYVFNILLEMSQVHAATVKVIKNGRITIPQEIRDLEDITEGDYLKITIEKIEKEIKNK